MQKYTERLEKDAARARKRIMTPNLPLATASLLGMTLAGLTRANLARAAVEGLLCSLADALQSFADRRIAVRGIRLIGGGARSRAVQQLAPLVLGCPVSIPPAGEYVADGAARQGSCRCPTGSSARGPTWPWPA